MKCKKIVLGYVPVMRDTFPVAPARQMRDRIRARVDEILQGNEHIELADAAPLLPDGMLWDNADVEKVAAFLEEKHADALFLPHCNFGQEEAAAKLAARLGRPVLLWGPRDPAPEGLNFRPLDIQCGLFATSKALVRYGVPFTYLENCNLDSEILAEGLDRFARTVAVVKAMRGMRVGQIGLRPRQFLSVKVNESELLEKLGIEVTPIWTEEITTVVAKLRSGNADKIGRVQKIELPMATKRLGTLEDRGPDPSIRQRMEDIQSKSKRRFQIRWTDTPSNPAQWHPVRAAVRCARLQVPPPRFSPAYHLSRSYSPPCCGYPCGYYCPDAVRSNL